MNWLPNFHLSQALTDAVLDYEFEMYPGAQDIFNHVGEWHKP